MAEPASKDTEVVVLGAGPGGYSAAFRAADLGRRVTLVERYPRLGGVCLNVGCIPSKALLHTAKVIGEAADLSKYGIAFGDPKIDLAALRAAKDNIVKRPPGTWQLAKKRTSQSFRPPHGSATTTRSHSTGRTLLQRWPLVRRSLQRARVRSRCPPHPKATRA
jgi:dihydrolipoamide dehydrogenase